MVDADINAKIAEGEPSACMENGSRHAENVVEARSVHTVSGSNGAENAATQRSHKLPQQKHNPM